jgi:hypothetical protein
LVSFPRFGILCREKSGNPGTDQRHKTFDQNRRLPMNWFEGFFAHFFPFVHFHVKLYVKHSGGKKLDVYD